MRFDVRLADDAVRDIEAMVRFLRSEGASERVADQWLGRLLDRIDALDSMPERFPVAEFVSQMP